MPRHAFIIGGTGQIGRAVAADLLARGWHVTLASRATRPPGLPGGRAAVVNFDRNVPGALAAALAGGADAVIDTVAFHERHADQLLDVATNVATFVVISSSSVYRDEGGRTLDEAGQNGFPDFPQPITKSQATVAPGPDTYSTQKIALERRLLDRAKPPVTILRPCAIHGPHSVHPREWWFVKRMLDRRKAIPLAYRGQSRFHTSAVTNIAALTGIVLEKPATQILNIADPVAPTVAEIGAAIGRHLGYEGTILPVDAGDDKRSATFGLSPWSVPAPFVLNTDAAAALGYRPATTYEASVPATCDWLMQRADDDWKTAFPILASYPYDLFDYAQEDDALA